MQQFLQLTASIVFCSVALALCVSCYYELTSRTKRIGSRFTALATEISAYIATILLTAWVLHQAKYGTTSFLDFKSIWLRDGFNVQSTQGTQLYPWLISIFGRLIEDANFGLSISLSFLAWLGSCFYFYCLTREHITDDKPDHYLRNWLVFPLTIYLLLPGNTSLLTCLAFASLWYWHQKRFWLFLVCAAMAVWTDIYALALLVPITASFFIRGGFSLLAFWALGLALSLFYSADFQPNYVMLSGWPLILLTKHTHHPIISELTLIINLLATGVVLYAQILA